MTDNEADYQRRARILDKIERRPIPDWPRERAPARGFKPRFWEIAFIAFLIFFAFGWFIEPLIARLLSR